MTSMTSMINPYTLSLITIPHSVQRYSTAGDWQAGHGHANILASHTPVDKRYERLVLLHELVECLLCKWTGVSTQVVDEWDLNFDFNGGEPGDDPKAPYHRQHVIASVVERLAAELLGVDWNAYERALEQME